MGTPVRLAIGFMEVPPPLVEELSPSWGSHGRVEWGRVGVGVPGGE